MPEIVRQSTENYGFNTDKSNNNNLVGNLVHKQMQINTASIYDSYKPKGTCNDFSGVSQDETKSKSDLGLDI